MSFHEVQFPTRQSFGSLGGPERRTEVVALVNGFEERNSPWAHSRRRYDAGVGMRSMDDVEELIAFFEARHGQLHGFRWKDWADFTSCAASAAVTCNDQSIATAVGSITEFQLVKTYHSGPHSYTRPIRKPVVGTVIVGVDGVALSEGADFTVDATTGLVSLAEAPSAGAEITAGYEFDVPVRFDSDLLQTNAARFKAGEIPNVPIVEVRV